MKEIRIKKYWNISGCCWRWWWIWWWWAVEGKYHLIWVIFGKFYISMKNVIWFWFCRHSFRRRMMLRCVCEGRVLLGGGGYLHNFNDEMRTSEMWLRINRIFFLIFHNISHQPSTPARVREPLTMGLFASHVQPPTYLLIVCCITKRTKDRTLR